MPSVCKSCGDPVTWVTLVSGKHHPLNPEPDPEGLIYPVVVDGVKMARIATEKSPMPRDIPATSRFTSHFATCPDADEHRKPKGKGK